MDSWLPIAYIDTRGRCAAPVTFTEAVVKGLAEGGGLFVPETLPKLSLESILSLAEIPYAKRAAFIYRSFGIDLPDTKIDELMDETYGDRFDDEAICPITSLRRKHSRSRAVAWSHQRP